ncbi:MAG: nucleotidyltransferase family protein [Anderseniella sp.]
MLGRMFKPFFARQAWPDPDTALLIKAVVAPDDEARDCWRKWKLTNDIDDCSWPQFKILSRFSGRLPRIDPECPEIPRLHGMAKALWTKSQLQLNRSARALDVLNDAGIEACLMKTAAMEALAPIKLTRRVTSDIDLMVRRNALRKALELLYEKGWAGPETAELALKRCRYHPGVNLTRGSETTKDNSDVDVHHQPVHLPFLPDGTIEDIWARARPATFRGRHVLVPAGEELFVFTAMQGARRFIPSHLSSGMWALDLAEMATQLSLDWAVVLDVAEKCRGSWALLGCMTFLNQELHVSLPAGVLTAVRQQATSFGDAANFYAQSPTHGPTRYFNLPLRELVLINRHKAFCRAGHRASENW